MRRPLVLWLKTPIRQVERPLDLRLHCSEMQLASRECKFCRRIRDIAFDGIQCNSVVAHALAPQVAAESRMAPGPRDLAVPLRASGNPFGRVRGTTLRAANRIDEISVRLQRTRFEVYVQRRVVRRENARDRSFRRWRFEFARANGKNSGIVSVVKLPTRGYGQMARRQNLPRRPVHLSAKLEMFECIVPCFDRVAAQQRVSPK